MVGHGQKVGWSIVSQVVPILLLDSYFDLFFCPFLLAVLGMSLIIASDGNSILPCKRFAEQTEDSQASWT